MPIRLDGLCARPDVVFTKAKVAILLDGCWWHGCSEHGMRPKRNAEFWNRKIDATIERDRRVRAALEDAGWTVVQVWEHEPPAEASDRIEQVVRFGDATLPSSRVTSSPPRRSGGLWGA
jgi:DNA mismatch endonuclease (patch repair protein)